MNSGIRTKRLVIFSFLLSFLFSGIGVVSGLPIFFTALAHAHPVFFSEDNNRIRLILHHPGNHDDHETGDLISHEHDFLDRIFAVSEEGGLSHKDHEIEISATEDVFSNTAKTDRLLDTASASLVHQYLSLTSSAKADRFSARPPPGVFQFHEILSSTILLI